MPSHPSPLWAAACAIAFGLVFFCGLTAMAAEPPKLFVTKDLGTPTNPLLVAAASSSESLPLYLSIGSRDSDLTTEVVCVDGEGDEVCGFTIVLEAVGDLTFAGFCQSGCAPGLVYHIDANQRFLRINQVGVEINDANSPYYVGDIDMTGGDNPGFVYVDATSNAVSANLQLFATDLDANTVVPPVCAAAQFVGGFSTKTPLACALPEPGLGLGLGLGALVLGQATRRRRSQRRLSRTKSASPHRSGSASCRSTLFAISLGATLGVGTLPGASYGQVFLDETSFLSAIGTSPSTVDFSTVPLSPSGFARASNGDPTCPGLILFDFSTE